MAADAHTRSTGERNATTHWVRIGIVVWVVIVGGAMFWLAGYSNQAGQRDTSAPRQFPANGGLARGKYRLLMFAHPRCPCTTASVQELARIMSNATADIDAIVYFFQPRDAPHSWASGGLWNSAAAIPGVRTQADIGGAMAAQFGSTTSGDVLLYDASGRLCFQGGITPGRGHEGDNLGKSAVISSITGDRTHADHSPVFGCPIRSAPAAIAE